MLTFTNTTRSATRTNRRAVSLAAAARATIEPLEPRQLFANVTWDGGGDGVSFFDPANWNNPDFIGVPLNGNALPRPGDNVSLGSGGAVNFDGIGTYASLSSSRVLNMTGGALSVNATVSGGTLNLSGGTVFAGSGFESVTTNFSGGSFNNANPFVFSNCVLNITTAAPLSATFVNAGILSGNLSSSQSITALGRPGQNASLTWNGAPTVSGAVTLSSIGNGGATIVVSGGLTISPTGSLTSTNGSGGGGSRLLSGTLTNNGSVTIDYPTTFSIAGGIYTNNANFAVTPSGSLSIGGNSQRFVQNAGTLSGAQRLNLDSIVLDLIGGTVVGDANAIGTVTASNSLISLAPAFTTPVGLTLFSSNTLFGNPISGQDVTVQGRPGINANLSVPQAGGLNTSGRLTFTSTGNGGASAQFAGGLTINPAGTLTITNSSGGGGGRTITGSITNNGATLVDYPAVFSSASGVYTNNAIFTIAGGGFLSIAGQSQRFIQNTGSLSGAQRLGLSSIFFDLVDGVLRNDDSALGTPTLSDSQVTLLPTFTTPIELTLFSSNVFVGNPLSGQDLVVQGRPGINANLSVPQSGGLNTSGRLTFTSTGNGGASAQFAGGLTVNPAGALTITNSSGGGGGRTITGSITNNGTTLIDYPATFSTASGVYTNNASFSIAGGGSLAIAGQSQRLIQNAGILAGAQRLGLNSILADLVGGVLRNDGPAVGTPTFSDSQITLFQTFTTPIELTLFSSNTFFGNPLSGQDLIVQGRPNINANLNVPQIGGLSSSGRLTFTSTGNGAANAQFAGGLTINASATLTITNSGGGGSRTITGSIINNGTALIDYPAVFSTANGVYTNNASLTVASGGSLSIVGQSQRLVQNTGVLSGAHRLALGAIYLDLVSGALRNDGGATGTPTLSDSQITLAPTFNTPVEFTLFSSNTFYGNPRSGQDLIVQGRSGINANLSVPQAGGMNTSSRLTFTSTGNGAANAQFAGGLTINPSATLTVTNSSGGGGSRTLTGNLINNGNVLIDYPATFSTASGVYTNNASFTVTPTGTLSIVGQSQHLVQNSGMLSGAHRLGLNAIYFDLFGGSVGNDNSALGTPTLSDSQITLAPTFTTPIEFTLFSGNTFYGNPRSGQDLVVQGRPGINANLSVPQGGGMQTSGRLTFTSTGNGAANAQVPGGLFINATATLMFTNSGGGGSRTLTGHLVNNGTTVIDYPTTFSTAGGIYTNNASFTVASGGALTIAGQAQHFVQNAGSLSGAQRLNLNAIYFDLIDGTVRNDSSALGTPTLSDSQITLAPTFETPIELTLYSSNTLIGNLLSGQDVVVQGRPGINATLSIPQTGGLTLAGVLTLTSTGNGAPTVAIPNGLIVAPSGSILAKRGTGNPSRSISASITNNGRLDIDAGVTVAHTGALALNSAGEIRFGFNTDTEFGRWNTTGVADLGGQISARLADGYAPANNVNFTVLTYAARPAGDAGFNAVSTNPNVPGITTHVNQGSNVTSLSFLGTPSPVNPVDFNGDGTVDPDDLADFIGAFFTVPPDERADFNGDGIVDPDDLADYISAYFS